MNQKVVRSKASTVVASLAGVAHSSECGQEDGAMLAGELIHVPGLTCRYVWPGV